MMPEFGFIGRSNVGKSSLINLITGNSRLAKISGSPGKTRTINHFLINESWYLVDLPGYGFARVPVKIRQKWNKVTEEYILKRENLFCLFVLIDSRHKPQNSDLSFMEFLGRNNIPFARVFNTWESLPTTFISSIVNRAGREEILNFIEETINNFSNPV
jgi:GTP-binding protein